MAPDEIFRIDVTVRNQGNVESDRTTLRYYQSTDSTISTSDTEVDTDSVTTLDPSESDGEYDSPRTPEIEGTYYYGACVDSVTDETDTTNNCSAGVKVTVIGPDLVVESPSVNDSSPDPGQSFMLSVTVRNQGGEGERSSSTTLRYYRSTDSSISSGDTEVGTDRVSSLPADDTSDESITLNAPTTPGTFYYGACVDAESDESVTNNNCSTTVTITVSMTSTRAKFWLVAVPAHAPPLHPMGSWTSPFETNELSRRLKSQAVGHRVISSPTSLTTFSAMWASTPSIQARSTSVIRQRWLRASKSRSVLLAFRAVGLTDRRFAVAVIFKPLQLRLDFQVALGNLALNQYQGGMCISGS